MTLTTCNKINNPSTSYCATDGCKCRKLAADDLMGLELQSAPNFSLSSDDSLSDQVASEDLDGDTDGTTGYLQDLLEQ